MATRKRTVKKKPRKKSLKEKFTGLDRKTGKVRSFKEAALGGLSAIDLQRSGRQSVLEAGVRKVTGNQKKPTTIKSRKEKISQRKKK